MRSLDMSIVFKLNSVEDLGMLTAALKQVKTLQEMVKLENDIKQLKWQKNVFQRELKEIKSEIHTLCPEKLLKSNIDEKKEDVEEENVEQEPEPSANEAETEELQRPSFDAVRVEHVEGEEAAPSSLIEERTDGEPQGEEESIV